MLKAVVSDINTVDEAHRGFYAEKDGKFVLQVTAAEGYELDNVAGLRSALGAERNLKKGMEDKLKTFDGLDAALARQAVERLALFGDITPDAAKTALETAQRLAAFDPEKEADKIANTKFETAKGQLQQQFTQREQELLGKIDQAGKATESLTAQLKTLMRDNLIKSELAKANPLDDARDAIELLAGQYVRTSLVDGKVVTEVVDPAGNPRIKDHQGTPFTVADLIAEIRESKPGLFKADEKRGVGISPNSGSPGNTQTVNPWVKESWNLTQQMLLENTKPDLAKTLKAQAGVKD